MFLDLVMFLNLDFLIYQTERIYLTIYPNFESIILCKSFKTNSSLVWIVSYNFTESKPNFVGGVGPQLGLLEIGCDRNISFVYNYKRLHT